MTKIYVKYKKWTIFASFVTNVPPECHMRAQTKKILLAASFYMPILKMAPSLMMRW